MTVFVKESSESVLSGLSKMKTAMIEDYNSMLFNDEMKANFADGISVEYGSKYIKIVKTLGSQRMVWGFIVGVDNDKKFKKGDILKPAGYAAPALSLIHI